MPMEPDLYCALREKDLTRVRQCLRDWGDENKRVWWTGTGRALTPLHVASKGSSQDILSELLRHDEIARGINAFSDKTSVTPLHEAAGSSSPEVVRLLLEAGADLLAPSGDRSTAFHIACSRGRLETCVELLVQGSFLEGRDAEGMTPLLRATAAGRVKVTRWLLDAGANLAAENAEGHCPVSLAALSGKSELLDMMFAAMAGSGGMFRDGGGCILYEAVDRGLSQVVGLLTSVRGRDLGVNINKPNDTRQGTTPLHAACFRGQLGIVGQLLTAGADPNTADENGLRPLHIACASPDSQPTVRNLLRAKAHANILDDFGCSPLYYAFVRGNDETVRYLLSRGASLFRMDYDQALRIACFYGMAVEVESLLWMESDPTGVLFNHRDRGTAFHYSVNPAVRDAINELLTESINGCGDGDGGGGGVTVSKEAAAAWAGSGACASPPSPCMTSSTSDSSGWTSGADANSSGKGLCPSSSGGSSTSSEGVCRGGDAYYKAAAGRVRESFGLRREERGDEGEDDGLDDEDDAFIVPSFRVRDDSFSCHETAAIDGNGEDSTTGAAATLRRWGQRVRTAGGTKAAQWKDGSVSPSRGRKLEGVKDRAKAKIVGAIKWAYSPRGRKVGGFAGWR